MGRPTPDDPDRTVRRAGPPPGARRIPEGLGLYPRSRAARTRALAAPQRLLPEQPPRRGRADAGDPPGDRQARADRPDDRRRDLRSRRDGGRPRRDARQGAIRLRGEHPSAALHHASGRPRWPGVPGVNRAHRHRADAALDGRDRSGASGRAGGPRPARKGPNPAAQQPGERGRQRRPRRRALHLQRARDRRCGPAGGRRESPGGRQGPADGAEARRPPRPGSAGGDKFPRYFSPEDRNRPGSIDELYRDNDVELFDVQADPAETTNLAAVKGQHPDLVLTMSRKLEAMIKGEIGVDDGREMPEVKGITWTLDIKGNDTVLD